MNIAEQLKAKSIELKELAKQASENEVAKSIAVATLVSNGIEKSAAEKAVSTNVETVSFDSLVNSVDYAADVLEKVASYIETMQEELAIATQEVDVEKVELLHKVAEKTNLSEADLEVMAHLSPEALEKIASASSEPWGMGSGAGPEVQKLDPLLAFCMS